MSKKDLVKQVIDTLIGDGMDFHELTQGMLAKVEVLDGVSKTTIKRAKNEYKREKIVVQSNYKENLIKRKIYKYLDRNPKSSLGDLREALPELAPSKVSEYHQFWRKKRDRQRGANRVKPTAVSSRKLKEMIFDYLNNHNDVTTEELYNAFPNANRSSVSSYLGHWKKKQASHERGKEGSLFQVIMRFLDQNPNASIEDIKRSFVDVPRKTIEIYHTIWEKKHADQEAENQESASSNPRTKRLPEVSSTMSAEKGFGEKSDGRYKQERGAENRVQNRRKTRTGSKAGVAHSGRGVTQYDTPRRSENNVISRLLDTIEEQKITLTALEVEHSILKESQSEIFKELENVSPDELEEVKEFIVTYIEGMRNDTRSE